MSLKWSVSPFQKFLILACLPWTFELVVAGGQAPEHNLAAQAQQSTANWCQNLAQLGHVLARADQGPIQNLRFDGRFHYQWANSYFNNRLADDFSGEGLELRRLRLGTKLDFLNEFHLRFISNLAAGNFRDEAVDFDSVDELYLQYRWGKILLFDDLLISYGRHKYNIGIEVHESSNVMRTVERTSLSGTLYRGGRPTGLLLSGEVYQTQFTLGYLSNDLDSIMGRWRNERAYYLSLQKQALGGRWVADFLWSDGNHTKDDVFGYRWAGSLGYQTQLNHWNFVANALGGEGFDERGTFGFYLMPSSFVIEDKLELVLRYALAKGSGDLLRENGRNARNVAPTGTFGELDWNQSLYAGLNYHFCKDRAKLMLGLEYEEFEGPATDLEGLTLWAAIRVWF